MCKRTTGYKSIVKMAMATLVGFWTAALTHTVMAEPAQTPLFLTARVKPITMLNMSRDHQLYFKLYDDFSDITDSRPLLPNTTTVNDNYGKLPDDEPDKTYVHGFDYYGYFDSYKCYSYNTTSNQFNPASFTATKYCNAAPATGQWSGNFLNWASMTRMDAVRKILYGGMRSTDSTTETVLERAYLPTDAHSFAKYYVGSDLPLLTPFAANDSAADVLTRGLTICNTSIPGTAGFSQAATASLGAQPVLRVARGNYSLWASSERFQCRWRSSMTDAGHGVNGNNSTASLINAYSDSPIDANKLGEYVARVAVCVTNLMKMDDTHDNEKCYEYLSGSAQKPRGLLQVHGATQDFALMTGSYGKNKTGGVLRKAASSIITTELESDGRFKVPGTSDTTIIKTLDLLRIYGYRYSDGLYHDNTHAVLTPGAAQTDGCVWGRSSFLDGQCVNWGNPQAEIYLESLRYLSGKNSPKFDYEDSKYIPGLNRVTSWGDPISAAANGNYCAPINVVQFDASMTSYDADNYEDAPSTIGDISTATDIVGAAENIHGRNFFVGQNGSDNNELCTAKTVDSLAKVLGACPDAPRLAGSYNIAGLSYKARSEGIGANREKVKTYGVALAASVPNVVVPVPGSSTAKVTILPACRNLESDPDSNCAIVDFKVVSQGNVPATTTDVEKNVGRLYVNWEDTEQGGDYDQDMWGVIDYEVTASTVTISTDAIAQSTPHKMGFGYIVGGTTADGFYVQSGINGFTAFNCTECKVEDESKSKSFPIGTSDAKLLKSPLYYAAKWGGYDTDGMTPSQIAALTTNKTYFQAIDPRKLEEKLGELFSAFGRTGSAATVASNSTRYEDDTRVYQALFDSDDWSGRLKAFPLNINATLDTANKVWDTDTTLTKNSTRRIYTLGNSDLINLSGNPWSTVSSNATAFRDALKVSPETDYTNAEKRFNWLKGVDQTGFRVRKYLLGDIINSDPAYAGANSQRYNLLPTIYGAATYEAYVDTKVARSKAVFVGANDGMLHAFDALTGAELFAYIPRGVYSKLASLSNINYSHVYTVDGPIYVGDAYYDSNGDTVKEWRTLVAGTLGAGGQGAYLLDVTDVLANGSGEPKVLFDISSSSPTIGTFLGYSSGRMLIVPTADGSWSAILSNGNESGTGNAALLAISVKRPVNTAEISTPNSYKVLDTKVGANGLSGAALLPDGNGVTTYAYAGDLLGNMWKFNLTSTSMSSWSISYGTASAPKPLIKVVGPSAEVQPITATPTLGKNSLKMAGSGQNLRPSIMIYFGTGKYSEVADAQIPTTIPVQSIYGIADTDQNTAIGTLTTSGGMNRTTILHKKTISSESNGVRTVANDKTPTNTEVPAVDWSSKDGWFLDLVYNNNKLTERVISKPLLLFDRVIINTFIPSANKCDFGGSGWLMELTGVGDKFIGLTVLANDANHQLDDPILGELIPILAGEKVIILGSGLGTDIDDPDKNTVQGFIGDAGPGSRGRMSWRQIK